MQRLTAVWRWLVGRIALGLTSHRWPSPAMADLTDPTAPQSLAELNARSWRAQEGR